MQSPTAEVPFLIDSSRVSSTLGVCLLSHLQFGYTGTYGASGNSPPAIASSLISEKQLLPQLPWPWHSLGRWKAVVEARADMNRSPGGDVNTHPERRSCLWCQIWTRHVSFWWPRFCSKTLKTCPFPMGLKVLWKPGLLMVRNVPGGCLSLPMCLSLDLENILSLTLLTQVRSVG